MEYTTLKQLFQLLEKSVSKDYFGEAISQLEHSLQCGDLAYQAGADEEMILAAFFHDIGHICEKPSAETMGDFGIKDHERIGADFLAQFGFSKRVCDLVCGHVNAKRYLAFKNKNYLTNLSPASLATLDFQGGAMSEDEAQSFENEPAFKNLLQIRAWDELAKVVDKKTQPLSFFISLTENHLKRVSTDESVTPANSKSY